jgi:hypothetical protein
VVGGRRQGRLPINPYREIKIDLDFLAESVANFMQNFYSSNNNVFHFEPLNLLFNFQVKSLLFSCAFGQFLYSFSSFYPRKCL